MDTNKCLNYDLDFFIDISRQLAFKRCIHKTFKNVLLNVLTSSLMTWSAFSLTSYFLPDFLVYINLVTILVICIIQDTLLGLTACLVYPVIFYHAIFITDSSFFQTCSTAAVAVFIQEIIGQVWIEQVEPFSAPSKSESVLFQLVDFYNDAFLGLYHNAAVAFLRAGIRTDLLDKSNIVLRKIIDRVQKEP